MFFNKLSGIVRASCEPSFTHRFVEKVVVALGESISEANNFESILGQALHSAELYFNQQIEGIPGPFNVSVGDFGSNTFSRMIFPMQEHVQAALGRSIEVRDFLPALAKGGTSDFFGLMGAREKSTNQLEPGLQLVDHTIRSIGHTEEYCRESLLNSCLYRLLGLFRERVETLRSRGRLRKAEWTVEGLAGNSTHNDDPASDFVLAEHALQPDNLLKGLVAWLEVPEIHFRIESSVIAFADQSGVRTELPVMRCADRRHWVVSLVRIPVQEALEALASESRCHRYILI